MSEKLLKFLLSELKTVRLVCQGKIGDTPCGMVFEVPVEHLNGLYHRVNTCSVCGNPFHSPVEQIDRGSADPFTPLFKAIYTLSAMKNRVQVEFVMPVQN